MTWELIEADCIETMAEMDENSVDAIVTDPPYGLGFMGKRWDQPGAFVERKSNRRAASFESFHGNHNPTDAADAARTRQSENQKAQSWHETWAAEALRVLKPGGYLLAFGGTRTYHRLVCALEDAGFEIRDCFCWLYGSGFPKSLDVSKAIDKAAGAGRGVVAKNRNIRTAGFGDNFRDDGWQPPGHASLTAPATPDAERWSGWGTALKPAFEPIVVARKPLSERTVAANVLRWGTGALNIDGCRIEGEPETTRFDPSKHVHEGWRMDATGAETAVRASALPGRWPANVALDEEAAAMLDVQSGQRTSGTNATRTKIGSFLEHGGLGKPGDVQTTYGDSGGASRFFYCAKASRKERGEGNKHPTVKPVALMQWLVRLVTPPGGTVLDPFAGSGSTGIAVLREGFNFIGIEKGHEYVEIARERIGTDAPLFDMEGVGDG